MSTEVARQHRVLLGGSPSRRGLDPTIQDQFNFSEGRLAMILAGVPSLPA